MSTYRRSGSAKAIPLPNLSPYLAHADEGFYYGTRGKPSRLTTLCRLAYLPHEPSEHLTSVEINIPGSFQRDRSTGKAVHFSDVEFFYGEEARVAEIEAFSDVCRNLKQSAGVKRTSKKAGEETDWSDPESFLVDHPELAPLLFAHFPRLKVLGLPMQTNFGEIVMMTMFRKRDAACLIRWAHVRMETVDVTLETPGGVITLPKRETVDPRYRRPQS